MTTTIRPVEEVPVDVQVTARPANCRQCSCKSFKPKNFMQPKTCNCNHHFSMHIAVNASLPGNKASNIFDFVLFITCTYFPCSSLFRLSFPLSANKTPYGLYSLCLFMFCFGIFFKSSLCAPENDIQKPYISLYHFL